MKRVRSSCKSAVDVSEEKFLSAVTILREEYALLRTMKEQICVDKNGEPIPWYTYPAIEYLKQLDFSEKKIFEFGSGNSSLFWAGRSSKVCSVEENKEWFTEMTKRKKNNMTILFRRSGEKYYNAIVEQKEKFDIVVVDGNYDRDKCCENAIKKVTQNGLIILDNSDRVTDMEEYARAVSILKKANLIQVDFCGFGPINNYTWITSLFFTRQFDFPSVDGGLQPKKSIGNV